MSFESKKKVLLYGRYTYGSFFKLLGKFAERRNSFLGKKEELFMVKKVNKSRLLCNLIATMRQISLGPSSTNDQASLSVSLPPFEHISDLSINRIFMA